MNSKVKAGLITAGVAVWCVVVATTLQFASKYITIEQMTMGLIAVGVGLCFYTLYNLILTKLEFDAKITEMVDRK
jgi:multisubunit Na+/H+ antiporter MnhB subunit